MKREIKEQWVAALRSGEYKQGRTYRHRDMDFCCLGVLCDLHSKATGTPWQPATSGVFTYGGNTDVLPFEVTAWAGLLGGDPKLGSNESAVSLNDGGASFAQIADLIEAHL